MALLKCKMCGGDLTLTEGSAIALCEYCGSMQTLPRLCDDRLTSFYERANDLRMSHEFDKAGEIYERILEETPTDSDVYWALMLCRYGIEYVEETKGGIRKPTINRAQLVSVYEDANYRSAIKYAEAAQKKLYEEEAARIDRILQRYMEISRNEPAYDVFICYKETDANGSRTIDSVRAGEIYRELAGAGFKVFYAPVTLESKLGEDYEPYIFAAINSAKVMLVIGTKPEYMNAPWVKNEWSRFLALAKEDSGKTLIPVYSGMDPYDMPEAFRFKQSQDMAKIGFILDLVRGIEKLTDRNIPQRVSEPVIHTDTPAITANVDTLLQRAAIFLEDQDWSSANIYCEKALDVSPTNGKAYFYKLLAEAKVTNERALEVYNKPLEELKAYKNAVRYADEETTTKLIAWNHATKNRLLHEAQKREEIERVTADFHQKKRELSKAIDDTTDLLKTYTREKTRLESQLSEAQNAETNLQEYKNQLRTRSLMVLGNCLAIAFLLFTRFFWVGLLLWIPQFVFTMLLAGTRRKHKGKAFVLNMFTLGIFTFIPALKGLVEAGRATCDNTQDDQIRIQTEIQYTHRKIENAQQTLNNLNIQRQDLVSDMERTINAIKSSTVSTKKPWSEVAMPEPDCGYRVESCRLTQWHKQPGDQIKVGDGLFTYETDTASFVYKSTEWGTLAKIVCQAGDAVRCLTTVCYIDPQ